MPSWKDNFFLVIFRILPLFATRFVNKPNVVVVYNIISIIEYF